MVRLNYPYLISDCDRYGTRRYYVRRFGRKVRIRATPGTETFARAYHDALQLSGVKFAPQLVRRRSERSAGWRPPTSLRRNFGGSPRIHRRHVGWS